jgi:hypothetical protein
MRPSTAWRAPQRSKDSLIALDEINQGDPHAVDKALYTIGASWVGATCTWWF